MVEDGPEALASTLIRCVTPPPVPVTAEEVRVGELLFAGENEGVTLVLSVEFHADDGSTLVVEAVESQNGVVQTVVGHEDVLGRGWDTGVVSHPE